MIPIALSGNEVIYCTEEGRFSFFNSPYPAHIQNTGIDIYSQHDFGETAPSPVEGEIFYIRKVKSPKGQGFNASKHDVVLLLKNTNNPDQVIKILHVDPVVEIGDYLKPGDDLGVLLRSGYFGWGTSPHLHLEVRTKSDPLRARGGYPINLIKIPENINIDGEIVGKVIYTKPENTLIQLNNGNFGLTGAVGGIAGVLDGGIPYYGWLGVHMKEPPLEGVIRLMGLPIADISVKRYKHSIAQCREFFFSVDNNRILGLSLYLSPKTVLIKLIPLMIGGLNLDIGDFVKVEIHSG